MSSRPKTWSTWQCVISTASILLMFARSACCLKSADVSTNMVVPLCSMRMDVRSRLSRGSSDRHVSQSHAIDGTPVEVPVPKKFNFILLNAERSQCSQRSRQKLLCVPCDLCVNKLFYFLPKMSAFENFLAAFAFSFSSAARTIVTYCIRRSASNVSRIRPSCG